LLKIAKGMSQGITDEMDAIYQHLKSHKDWERIMAIKNNTLISRQDDNEVGLLRDEGITAVLEAKQSEDDAEGHQKLTEFIGNNLAVSKLTAAAKKIDSEFQSVMKAVMTRFGDYKPGPIKRVDRCVSKLENDYQNAAFPKAAKLLDMVRCSVAFNTITQLLEGYEGFMKYINNSPGTIKLARIKNGFIGNVVGGYRDLKINVVFHSATDPDLKMICEVQLILNQYLYEKKKMHKLYSVIRDEVYYKMASQKEDDDTLPELDIGALKFEPTLNVKNDVTSGINDDDFTKCAVQSELGLLCMKPFMGTDLKTIDMASRSVVFDTKCYKGHDHIHHWLRIDDRFYLSVQCAANVIKFFSIEPDSKSFTEDDSLKLSFAEDDIVQCFEFDKNCENVFLVKNFMDFQQRAVTRGHEVVQSMTLEAKLSDSSIVKYLAVCDDGTLCAIAGGTNKFWYLIDVQAQKQTKVVSKSLTDYSFSPTFVNGETETIVISGKGKFEIWDIASLTSLKVINVGKASVYSTCSVNNLLAVGSFDKNMYLYDVRSWDEIYSHRYQMEIQSLHLTEDLKYLTIGGTKGELCVVLEIK